MRRVDGRVFIPDGCEVRLYATTSLLLELYHGFMEVEGENIEDPSQTMFETDTSSLPQLESDMKHAISATCFCQL